MADLIVTFLEMDNDWDAVYFDNKCVMQDHSLRARDLVELIAEREEVIVVRYHALSEEEQRYLDDCGSLPEYLDEITSGRWMEEGRKFWAKHGEPKR